MQPKALSLEPRVILPGFSDTVMKLGYTTPTTKEGMNLAE